MAKWFWTGGAVIALGASLAIAQDAPESLLPPGFDDPAPAPTPAPAPRPTAAPTATPAAPSNPSTGGTPVVQPLPGVTGEESRSASSGPDLSNIPTLRELENMSTDELDELLGLKPKFDMPPAARRSLAEVGLLSPEEGGLPKASLANQPAGLVRAALAGTKGPVVSRWGHILLRRALASRLNAPDGMKPVEFAALRAQALNAIGEYSITRAIVQDVDAANWNDGLTSAALDAYVATADIVGACPVVRLSGTAQENVRWEMLRSICAAFAGEGSQAGRQLDRALRNGDAPQIDLLLAQRYAGAAGRGRRAVTIEWEGVEELTPWRAALSTAVGEEIPASLRDNAAPYYERVWSVAPMISLAQRAMAADRAAREGILSSDAMVDLYSQIYVTDGIEGEPARIASRLRDAYVAEGATERLGAMRDIWGGDANPDYGRLVLTAYAAARLPVSEDMAEAGDRLIASMLTAGLDKDAAQWSSVLGSGSEGWAQLALAAPGVSTMANTDAVSDFIGADDSENQFRSRLLLAGLAGLGRIDRNDLASFGKETGLDIASESRWSQAISRAADVENAALVALLAGLGMQGDDWSKMTPRHLFHIVSALNRVGLNAEARMIAAEAVVRS